MGANKAPQKRGAENEVVNDLAKKRKIAHSIEESSNDEGFVTDEDELLNSDDDFDPNEEEDCEKLVLKRKHSQRSAPTSVGYLSWKKLYKIFAITWPHMECDNASFTIARAKTNRFTISYEDIRTPELYAYLHDILFNDNLSYVDSNNYISNNGFSYSSEYIRYLLRNIPTLCKSNKNLGGKDEEIESLALHLFALRIVKEIRHRKLPLYAPKSPEYFVELAADFRNICDYGGEYHQQISPEGLKDYFGSKRRPNNGLGAKCSNCFMHDDRIGVRKANKDFSPLDEYRSFNLVRNVTYILKKIVHKNFYHITPEKIYSQICLDNAAAQFRPTYVKDLIYFLKNKHRIKIRRLLDLSAGWGDRGVACLASTAQGLCRYVGTDPNVSLQKPYASICQQFIPPGFSITSMRSTEDEGLDVLYQRKEDELIETFAMIIYPLPMEELGAAQLCPGGEKSDAMFTSIPYFNQEQYEGSKQSYKKYPSYSKWKKGFLHTLVNQAVEGVKVGGIIAINSAPITANSKKITYNITNDLEEYLNTYKHDKIRLKKLANFWYDGKPPSKTLIYQILAK